MGCTLCNRFAIAEGKMDAKVDAEANEKYSERHRYEVELANRGNSKAGRPDKPHNERRQSGKHKTRGAQTGKQQKKYKDECNNSSEPHSFLNALQLLVSERGRAWEHRILPRGERTCQLPAYVTVEPPAWRRRQGAEPVAVGLGRIGVSAVDRVGNESPLAVLDVSEMLPPPVVAPPTPVDVGVVE